MSADHDPTQQHKACPKCYFDNPISASSCEFCGWQLLDEQGEETVFMGTARVEDLLPAVPPAVLAAPKPDKHSATDQGLTEFESAPPVSSEDVTRLETEIHTEQVTQFQTYTEREIDSASPPARPKTFNLAGNLAHFEVQQIIGKGGMGAVYKAHDQTLERHVAIKVLRQHKGLDQAGKDFLLEEARTICKLSHPNIVTVFDIARGKDNNFIIMEWIDGETLDKLIPAEGLDLKMGLNYATQIVQGLVHAHQHHIIHSDIKPQNIMHTPEDGIKILDFGIAGLMNKHSLQLQDNATESEKARGFTGTPGYVSPEQALGKKHLDARSDIFAFGIVFYQLLTGKRPFDGKNAKEKNAAVITGDYPPLPSKIPQDIRAIVEHCLTLSPKNRYQTSAQLADDLQRFDKGNPVSVIDSKSYWLKKKTLKHKWPVLLVTLAALAGTGQLTWQQLQSAQQVQREQLLTRFTRQVENLEANVQLTRMSPAHDTTASQQAWHASIARIQAQIPELGDIAQGPGNYAIGRMYYVLQDYEKALQHLQSAWNAGFSEDRAAYYLALTHSALYQQQYAIIQNLDSNAAKRDRLEKLDARHKQPAIDYLQRGMSDSPFQAYAQALLTFYQGDNQQALNMLQQLSDTPAWFYEHHILRGDILLNQADKLSGEGNQDASDKAAQAALQSYVKAQELGRADFLVQLKPLSVINQKITNALYGDGKNIPELLERAKGYLNQAQIIAPSDYRVSFNQGEVLGLQSNYEKWFVGDPLATQDAMLEALERALELSPGNSDVLLKLGLSYARKLGTLNERDLSEAELLEKANNAFNAIPEDERDYFYYNSLGIFLSEQALFETEKNLSVSLFSATQKTMNSETSPLFKGAEKALKQASILKPQRLGAAINLGALYRDWSTTLSSKLANNKLLNAIGTFSNLLNENPEHFVVHYYLGMTYRTLARNQNFLLQDNLQSLNLARHHLDEAEELQPNHPYVVNETMLWFVDYAEYLWQSGENPLKTLSNGISYTENAMLKHPDNSLLSHNQNHVWLKVKKIKHFSPYLYLPELKKAKGKDSKTAASPIYEIFPKLLSGIPVTLKNQDITPNKFPGDYNLIMAEFSSIMGDYTEAEKRYLGVREEHMGKALHLLFHRQNYQRWQKHLNEQPSTDNSQIKKDVSEKLNQTEALLQQHFGELWQQIKAYEQQLTREEQ